MNTVSVYNTCTKKYEDVEVTDKVYTAYMHEEWNTHDDNEAFYDHEIQFSALIGGYDDNYENFHEFVDEIAAPHYSVDFILDLKSALLKLTATESDVIRAICFLGMTEREYADKQGISHQMVHRKKSRAMKKIKEFLC